MRHLAWKLVLYPLGCLLIFLSVFAAIMFAWSWLFGLLPEPAGWVRVLAGLGRDILASVGAVLVVFVWIKKRPFHDSPAGGANLISQTLLGFILGCSIFGLVIAILWLAGAYTITGFYWQTHSGTQVAGFLVMNLVAGLGVGIREEAAFRAGFFNVLEDSWGSWAALIVSSSLFGLGHLLNAHATLQGALAIIVEAGILLGAAYLLSRRLWFVVGLHWGWNFLEGPIAGSVVSGSGGHGNGLLVSTLSGPTWLTGGVFGPEAGLPAALVGGSLGVYFLIRAGKLGRFRPSLLNSAAVQEEPSQQLFAPAEDGSHSS